MGEFNLYTLRIHDFFTQTITEGDKKLIAGVLPGHSWLIEPIEWDVYIFTDQ